MRDLKWHGCNGGVDAVSVSFFLFIFLRYFWNCDQILYFNATDLKLGSSAWFSLRFPLLPIQNVFKPVEESKNKAAQYKILFFFKPLEANQEVNKLNVKRSMQQNGDALWPGFTFS